MLKRGLSEDPQFNARLTLVCSIGKDPPKGLAKCPFRVVIKVKVKEGVQDLWEVAEVYGGPHSHARIQNLGPWHEPDIRQPVPRLERSRRRKKNGYKRELLKPGQSDWSAEDCSSSEHGDQLEEQSDERCWNHLGHGLPVVAATQLSGDTQEQEQRLVTAKKVKKKARFADPPEGQARFSASPSMSSAARTPPAPACDLDLTLVDSDDDVSPLDAKPSSLAFETYLGTLEPLREGDPARTLSRFAPDLCSLGFDLDDIKMLRPQDVDKLVDLLIEGLQKRPAGLSVKDRLEVDVLRSRLKVRLQR
ncbi:hypothetical protein JCM11641_000693 [Rhodosporidiobolus odoratus]